MGSGMSSQMQVECFDAWSRILSAGALLLLLANLAPLPAPMPSTPTAYVPSASSAPGPYREAARHPLPSRNQTQPLAPRQGRWVF